MDFDVVIVGGGPGGLHCGQILANHGVRVLILEKNTAIGQKVCAGGITWEGLIKRIPEWLIERSFTTQTISTRYQRVEIKSRHPIIATVNRHALGSFMAEHALANGAQLRLGARVTRISPNSLTYRDKNKDYTITFDYLVGADGAFSKVREYLNIPVDNYGYGINYTLEQAVEKMEWHFDSATLCSGYTWIFPHKKSVSIGGYTGIPSYKPTYLNRQLNEWIKDKNIVLSNRKPRAAKISFDFRGWIFDNHFLIGDAAGLASALTGEGIHPAFVSAEAAAHSIIDRNYEPASLVKLIKKHRKHFLMHRSASKHKLTALLLSEISALLLRSRLVSFRTFEMA